MKRRSDRSEPSTVEAGASGASRRELLAAGLALYAADDPGHDLTDDRVRRRPVDAGSDTSIASPASDRAELDRLLRDALVSPDGATRIGFVNAAPGGMPRRLAERISETVSVLDFIPSALHEAIRLRTNSVDLTRFVQAAFAYADAVGVTPSGGGALLHFPAGDYRCEIDATNDDAQRFYAGAHISGDGRHLSRIVPPREGSILLNMTGRNQMSVSGIGFWSHEFSAQAAILLARSQRNTNCNNNKFTDLRIAGNYSIAAVISIGAESSLWHNCFYMNSNVAAAHRSFWTGNDPARLPLRRAAGAAPLAGGPNTDNRMVACEFHTPYPNARPLTFSSQGGWTMVGCTIICGEADGVRMVTYTDPVGGLFNGPVTWLSPHFEAFGPANVVHFLDAAPAAATFFNGVSHYGGNIVMNGGSVVDYDRSDPGKRPILRASTFTTPAFPEAVTGIDIHVFALVSSAIHWRPRHDPASVVIASGFVQSTNVEAAEVRTTNLAGSTDLTIAITAVPTQGTFAKGTLLRNVSGTIGQPVGWIITASGSFGSAGAIRVDTRAGSNLVQASGRGHLYPGCLVTIANAAAGGPWVVREVREVDGRVELFLGGAVETSVRGQLLSFVQPVATPLSALGG